jgi:hypothetical protein
MEVKNESMKKTILVFFTLLVLFSLAACGKRKDMGDPVLTVTGLIGETNKGDAYIVYQAVFDEYSSSMTVYDPWVGDTLKFKGLLLNEILTLVKPQDTAKMIVLKNTSGQTYEIKIKDARQYEIMLARWEQGDLLTEATGAPIRVIFPDKAKGEYTQDAWAWWVESIEIK